MREQWTAYPPGHPKAIEVVQAWCRQESRLRDRKRIDTAVSNRQSLSSFHRHVEPADGIRLLSYQTYVPGMPSEQMMRISGHER